MGDGLKERNSMSKLVLALKEYLVNGMIAYLFYDMVHLFKSLNVTAHPIIKWSLVGWDHGLI